MIKEKNCILFLLCSAISVGFNEPIGSRSAGGTMPLGKNGKIFMFRFEVRPMLDSFAYAY